MLVYWSVYSKLQPLRDFSGENGDSRHDFGEDSLEQQAAHLPKDMFCDSKCSNLHVLWLINQPPHLA